MHNCTNGADTAPVGPHASHFRDGLYHPRLLKHLDVAYAAMAMDGHGRGFRLPVLHCFPHGGAMFCVDEATAAFLRRVFGEEGELSAVIELRRQFPLITDTARGAARQPGHARASKSPELKPITKAVEIPVNRHHFRQANKELNELFRPLPATTVATP